MVALFAPPPDDGAAPRRCSERDTDVAGGRVRPDLVEAEAQRIAQLPQIGYAAIWAQAVGRLSYQGFRTQQMLVMGADLESPPERQREKILVQRTGQLMYELSTFYPDISGIVPEYGWDAAYARSGDGLPYIGPHRNFPRHLFAFGDASHSVTGAYLASRILLRHYLDDVL